MTTLSTRARPLLVRRAARFRCSGDGLCCTDLHALGPMTQSEVRSTRKLRPGSVIYHEEVEAPCMRTGEDGCCAQLTQRGCSIHRRFGGDKKPGGCRRFPYGLIATPLGGRVTTEHRCPCRTLGPRPPLDLEDAQRSLLDLAGRLEVDQRAPSRIAVSFGKRVPFARFAELEADLIGRLVAGESAERVLSADALPDLHEGDWPSWAQGFYDTDDGTRGGVAMSWFADALCTLHDGKPRKLRARPWSEAFDRGRARARVVEPADSVINDWVADELWQMRWLELADSFDVARAELATRLAVVRMLTRKLRAIGVREDQAAAEAVMIGEMAAACEHWADVVDAIANDPSPARVLPERGRTALTSFSAV